CEGHRYLKGRQVARDRDWHDTTHFKGGWLKASTAILPLSASFYVWPPVGGTFQFQTFILTTSLEIWRKTIFGGEGGCWRGKWGGLFWATSLEKIFGGVIAIISFRPGGWMQQSAVPRCAILSVRSTGGIGCETPRVHHAARRRGSLVAVMCNKTQPHTGRSQSARGNADTATIRPIRVNSMSLRRARLAPPRLNQ